jgi:hypothetical protein
MADSSEPTREEKIADALRAAPAYIADSATVVDWDMTTVLREGSPDWTCVPTPPGTPQSAPMCADPTMMQWFMELEQGKTPTIDRIGISYMLMGEVGADFDHPEPTNLLRARIGVRPIPGAEPLLVVPIALPGEKACGCLADAPVAATARPHLHALRSRAGDGRRLPCLP